MFRSSVRWIALAGTLLTALVATPQAALASCAVPPGGAEAAWQDFELVFIGEVTALENLDRRALVEVIEIWKGPDLPAEVVVNGGPDDPTMLTSVDRTYRAGVQYLFAVSGPAGNLQDNACSPTVEVDSIDIDGMRPADARTAGGDSGTEGTAGFDPAGLAGPAIVLGIIGLVVAAVVIANRRREA